MNEIDTNESGRGIWLKRACRVSKHSKREKFNRVTKSIKTRIIGCLELLEALENVSPVQFARCHLMLASFRSVSRHVLEFL